MDKIISGVQRFRETDFATNRHFYEQLAAKQQKPVALFITCADSRIVPNTITQTEPGDLFLIRNAGNIVPPWGAGGGGEGATIQYSLEVLGIRNIVVLGHSQCGAMKALLENRPLDDLPAIKQWFSHAEATRQIVKHKYKGLSGDALARAAAEENVLVQLNNISTHPSVASRLATGELNLYGWYYDIGTGVVRQYDQAKQVFRELERSANAASPMPVLEASELTTA